MAAALAAAGALFALGAPDAAVALHDMPCADLNGDGMVTQEDVNIEYSYLGQPVPPAPPQADLHPGPPISDEDVDVQDLQFVVARVGLPATCQDTPIGPKGAPAPVGGISRDANIGAAALKEPQRSGSEALGGAVTLAAGFVVAAALLYAGRRSRHRPQSRR